jgi:heme-degrading monooxygenase HmoA
MFAVIFEVQPKSQHWDEYLKLAGALRAELEQIDGFVDNERFASRIKRGWVLSLSTWRDEKAVIRWRTLASHHLAQTRGRTEIFEDYHLRVGEIIAESGVRPGRMPARQRLDETEIGVAKAVTISERLAAGAAADADLAADLALPKLGTAGLVGAEAFDSIVEPRKQLLLASWRDAVAAEAWQPDARSGTVLRHRNVQVIRDYGMHDRREAPQYYPAVGSPDGRR